MEIKAQQSFGRLLKEMRTSRKLSIRSLAAISGVNFAAIGAIERGRRPAGGKTANALAQGLNLTGDDRYRFTLAALSTTERERVPFEARALDPEVFCAYWDWLSAHKLTPSRIKSVSRESKNSNHSPDLVVELETGERIGIEFKIKRLK